MELIEQDGFPHPVHLLGRIGQAILRQHAEQLQIHHVQLGLAVGALVARHGGVGAAMILKVQLALPHRQAFAALHARVQFVKVGARKGLAHARQARDALFHAVGIFQHRAGGAAAAVAIAIGNQNVIVDFLLLIALPAADQRVRVQHAVIGGKEVFHRLPHAQGGDQVRQDLRAVDATPAEGIIGHFVKLIPGQLGCHKILDAALLHDLRQRAGIAKHVRQPQDAAVHAEFILEKALAVDELPHQRLAAGQVAVRLHPHAALGLPASLRHALPNARVQLGVALLEKGVQLRLAGHKAIVGILIHELEHRSEAAAHLFARLRHRPPPGHVDMRMADAGCNHIVMPAQGLV